MLKACTRYSTTQIHTVAHRNLMTDFTLQLGAQFGTHTGTHAHAVWTNARPDSGGEERKRGVETQIKHTRAQAAECTYSRLP